MEGEIDGLPYIEAIFSGRWSCEDAWIFFEQLMADSKYPFKDALIDSTMSGSESEEGSRYAAKISKSSGEQIITRKDTSDEKIGMINKYFTFISSTFKVRINPSFVRE